MAILKYKKWKTSEVYCDVINHGKIPDWYLVKIINIIYLVWTVKIFDRPKIIITLDALFQKGYALGSACTQKIHRYASCRGERNWKKRLPFVLETNIKCLVSNYK